MGYRSETPGRTLNPSNTTTPPITTRSVFVKASPLESPKYYAPFSCLSF
ncbi:hypothetical protein Gotur_035215 [Gossypium turneri]